MLGNLVRRGPLKSPQCISESAAPVNLVSNDSVPARGVQGRPNLLGWVPVAEAPHVPRAHLILNSHADTVGTGELFWGKQWR